MENALLVAAVLGPTFLLCALSLLLYPSQWQKIMAGWEKDHFSLITFMTFLFVVGILVVRMYNVWEWNVWLLVTLFGWAMIVKSVAFFLLPGSWLKSLLGLGKNKAWIYVGGLFALVFGVVLSYYAYFA